MEKLQSLPQLWHPTHTRRNRETSSRWNELTWLQQKITTQLTRVKASFKSRQIHVRAAPGHLYIYHASMYWQFMYRVPAAGTACRRSRCIPLYTCTPVCRRTSLLSSTPVCRNKVKVTCFSLITHAIFIRFLWNLASIIFYFYGNFPENFKEKNYYVVWKLDHLTCSNFELWRSSINPLILFSLNLEILLHVKWSNFWNTDSNFTKFSGWALE